MAERTGTRRPEKSVAAAKSPIQLAAAAVGGVFLLVGILGFVPGITTNLGDIEFVGHEAETELLGIFGVNVVHNLVHLGFGVVGLMLAREPGSARSFLIVGGLAYLVLWLYGLVIDLDTDLNFISLNTADNWLHFGLGAGMLALGLTVPRGDTELAR